MCGRASKQCAYSFALKMALCEWQCGLHGVQSEMRHQQRMLETNRSQQSIEQFIRLIYKRRDECSPGVCIVLAEQINGGGN